MQDQLKQSHAIEMLQLIREIIVMETGKPLGAFDDVEINIVGDQNIYLRVNGGPTIIHYNVV